MRIVFTQHFRTSFDRLPPRIQQKATKHIGLLAHDVRHPGVKARKMVGVGDIWEGRVDGIYRFTFSIVGDILVFRKIGTHEIYRKP